MNRQITLTMALATGLLGGLLSRYVTLPPVHAQGPQHIAKQIRAQSFTLVDENDNVVATFKPSVEPQQKRKLDVVLLDQNGREIWRAGSRMSLRALDAK